MHLAHSFIYSIPLILVSFYITIANAQSSTEEPGKVSQSRISFENIETEVLQLLPLSTHPISTIVGGFRLTGDNRFYRVSITDLDILITDDEQRLLPLLRLLKRLHADVTVENGLVIYAFQTGKSAIIDFQKSSLIVLGKTYPIKLIKGLSDITGKHEIYVSEKIFSEQLGLNYRWDEIEYSVLITTNENLNIFQKILANRSQPIEFDISELTENLPETESVKNTINSQQLLTFSQLSFDIKSKINDNQHYEFITPKLTLYGHLLGGGYKMSLSETINTQQNKIPEFPLWLEEFVWNSDRESFVIEAGDTGIGLTPVSIPFASFTGISFRGLTEDNFSSLGKKTFLDGNSFRFANEQRIEGLAPLGSTVEIFVNGRLSHSEVVKAKDGSAIGNGEYHLLISGGLNQTLNEVKTVITEVDGTSNEKVEYISSNISLLKQGQWAYSGGAGTRRKKQDGKLITQGFLAGAGFYYGLTNDMTIGFSLSSQNNFYTDSHSFEKFLDSRLYFGEHLSLKLSEKLFFTQSLGLNKIIDDKVQIKKEHPMALENTLEYKASSTLFAIYHFDYDQDYSAGDINLGNRKGWGSFIQSEVEDNLILNSAYANIKSNNTADNTQYLAAELKNQNWIHNTSLSLRADWIKQHETNIDRERKLYSFRLNSNLNKNIGIDFSHSWGEPIGFADNEDLRSGVPVPMITSSLPFGTRVSGKYKFSDTWSSHANYMNSGLGHKTAEFSVERNMNFSGEIKFKLLSRHDLINYNHRTIITLEYPFHRGGGDLLGLNVAKGNSTEGYNINLYLRISGLFTWDRFKPHYIARKSQIKPESGGIKGRVYLDSNTNGKYDEGEVGVNNIDILFNGRKNYRSGREGWFYIPRNERQDEIVVSLNSSSLPAIYTPTQGVQRAKWDKLTLTRVNLGIAILSSLSGKIVFDDETSRALSGVTVKLVDLDNKKEERKSVTDSYGEYYFGEIKTGHYEIQIINDSLPANASPVNEHHNVTINGENATEEIVIETININKR
jgi:hypothetical protein|tara:strand:- start:1361 stop:4393 length:3033 start_codon:yes stop_codon:yes gene_type:complete